MKDTFFSKIYPIILRTPIHKLILSKNSANEILTNLNDAWGGEADKGYEILSGFITFYGEKFYFSGSVWNQNNASETWRNELQSFSWIRHLRAVGSSKARIFSRKTIVDWVNKHSKWTKREWRSDILSKRICYLVENFSFFCSGSDEQIQKKIIKSISQQANHLINYNFSDIRGFERIYCIKALIVSALSFFPMNKYLELGFSLILLEIDKQVSRDGLHIEKSPMKHLEFLKILIDIRSFFSISKLKIPEKLNKTISLMAAFLKFFRHGDGNLATFNNSSPVSKTIIDQVLTRSNSRLKIPSSSHLMGFYRISENKLTFIMDGGNPNKTSTYAGSLSFELSFGKRIIIVNSGSPHIQNKRWAKAMKSSAAHTTLTIDDINSSDIFFDEFKSGRLAKVWSKKFDDNKCHWIESSHNGYKNLFGLIHNRKIHLDASSRVLRGQDTLVKTPGYYQKKPKVFFIRFHLHPDVEANLTSNKKKVILKLKDGYGWEFICSEPRVEIGEGIYLGLGSEVSQNAHIILKGKVIPERKIKWLFRLIN